MTRKTSLLVTAFAFAGLLTPAGANHGLTRFVSTDGIDSGDCLTNPCRTIQFAVDTANPGDVIWVRPGTYNENLMITKPNLTLQGSGASSTIISGDRTANVVTVFGVTSFTIERFTVRNAGKSGAVPGSAAIELNPNSGSAMGNWVVRRNILVGNGFGVALLNSLGGGTALIQNNLIANNDFMGIINIGHPHVTVRNNTIADNGFIGYYEFVGAANNIVENNVVARNGFGFPCTVCTATGIVVGPVGLNFISFNDVFDNAKGNYAQNTGAGFIPYTPSGPGEISADPKFRNAPYGDYGLSLDSPAIDAGTNTDAPPRDLDGVARPQDGNSDGVPVVDMGAFERRAVN